MIYDYYITGHFKKQLKNLVKKDRTLKEKVIEELESFQKKRWIPLGKNIYKKRISKGNKGKSGGYRLLILIVELDKFIIPVCIYSKNEKENISPLEISTHLDQINLEYNRDLQN